MLFLKFENNLPAIGLISLPGQHKANLNLAFPGIVQIQIKGQIMAVGDQITGLRVDTGPQHSWLDFVRHRSCLVQGYRQLPGGDHRAGSPQDVHVNTSNIALPLLVDFKDRNHHLLQGCAPMDKAGTGTLQAQAIDGLGYLDFHITGKAKLIRGKFMQARYLGKSFAEHKAPVPEQNLISLDIYA